jgi:HK97 family phage portal protein
MNIFKKFLGNSKSLKTSLLDTIGTRFNFFGQDDKELLNKYRGWVYRCVDITSNEVASVPLKLMKGDNEVPDSHELSVLMRRVNPMMSKFDLIKATQSFLSMHGDAFWYLSRDGEGEGKIREIWPLRPDWIKVVVSKNAEVIGYEYGPGREKTKFGVRNVIPFINFNPKFFDEKRPFRGMGDLEAALATVYEDDYIREWNKNLLKKGARIDGVLEYDGELDEEEKTSLENKWADKFGGSENAGKTAILTAGLKYNKIGMNQHELDFILQKKLNRDDLFLLFGIPKGLMIADDVNRSNSQSALYPFLRFNVKPKAQKIIDTLNEFLIPDFGPEGDLRYEYEDPVPEDREAKLNEFDKAVNRWMTINEVREKEGLKKVKSGNKLYVPFNLIELGENQEESTKEEEKKFIIKIGKQKSAYDELSKGQRKKIDNLVKIGKKWEVKYKEELKSLFSKMQRTALAGFSEKKAVQKASDDLFSELKKYANKYFGIFLPINKSIFNLIGKDAFDELDLDADFDESKERIGKYLDKMTKKAGDVITDETIEKLSGKVAVKIEEGAAISEIREVIKEYFVYASTARADRIARSEVFRTLNAGKQEAWRQSGVVSKKKWITLKDELTCPFCKPMDGKTIGLANNFFNKNDIQTGDNGKEMHHDYMTIEHPPLHANCRCTVVPILSKKSIEKTEEKKQDIDKIVSEKVKKEVNEINKKIDQIIYE